MRTVCLALALTAACTEVGLEPGDGAIEITGYMDAKRVSATATEQVDAVDPVDLVVVGRPGAAANVLDVDLTNLTSGEVVTVPSQPDGGFVAVVEVVDGDEIRVEQDRAPDVVDLEAMPLAAFPFGNEPGVGPPDDGGQVHVSLTFDGAQDLAFVLTNQTGGQVRDMMPLGELSDFVGQVPGEIGDVLLVHGVDEAGHTTLATEIFVPGS